MFVRRGFGRQLRPSQHWVLLNHPNQHQFAAVAFWAASDVASVLWCGFYDLKGSSGI